MTVILGSKPDPVLPEHIDAIVYVNASIYYRPKILEKYREEYHLITNQTLLEKPEQNSLTRRVIRNQEVGHFIEIRSADAAEMKYTWEELNYRFRHRTSLTWKDRERITNEILPRGFYFEVLKSEYRMADKIRKIKNCLKPGGQKHLSMGVFGLVYSLFKGIGAPPYYLCGVGVESDGYGYCSGSVSRGHELVDVVALRLLSRSKWAQSIFATDETLCRLTGVRFYQP